MAEGGYRTTARLDIGMCQLPVRRVLPKADACACCRGVSACHRDEFVECPRSAASDPRGRRRAMRVPHCQLQDMNDASPESLLLRTHHLQAAARSEMQRPTHCNPRLNMPNTCRRSLGRRNQGSHGARLRQGRWQRYRVRVEAVRPGSSSRGGCCCEARTRATSASASCRSIVISLRKFSKE